jgi:hypothetical protein
MVTYVKKAALASMGAAAFATLLASAAVAGSNTPGTSNNAANPLMTMEEFMAMAQSHHDCMAVRRVYDRHGHSLGQGMISTCS